MPLFGPIQIARQNRCRSGNGGATKRRARLELEREACAASEARTAAVNKEIAELRSRVETDTQVRIVAEERAKAEAESRKRAVEQISAEAELTVRANQATEQLMQETEHARWQANQRVCAVHAAKQEVEGRARADAQYAV